MPMKPKRLCTYPGCGELVASGRCDKHTMRTYDNNRPDWHKWYNTQRWRKVAARFLKLHPLCECEECKQHKNLLPAEVVDHIIPHKGNERLFWDVNNWMAMTKRCHDRKTAREDGGFGNRGRGV